VITLVLGGARSGKSEVAERLAGAGPVTYVATGLAADMPERVAAHKARRPLHWSTVETQDVVGALSSPGTVLVDSLTAWVAAAEDFGADVDGLCHALSDHGGDVGLRFRDALGVANQAVATVADDVLLVVAGRALRLDRM
jgi:adenosyl cobinamide kinase/adenosyl cobinamide phosphate guanylyltransferase